MTSDLKELLARRQPTAIDTWLAGVKRESAQRRAARDAEVAAATIDPRAALRARLAAWQATIAPDQAAAGFHLEDIRKAVPATLQSLGVALWELGWSRKRVWSSTAPYRRVWFPPN